MSRACNDCPSWDKCPEHIRDLSEFIDSYKITDCPYWEDKCDKENKQWVERVMIVPYGINTPGTYQKIKVVDNVL